MDIQTELPANVNPNAFSDQALVDNVQAMFSHFGITNVQAVQDQALPLPAKKRRDVALEGRQLGSGAKQFCLNPSTEIFGLIDTSKETSNNLNQGTACPFG
jgi:hypothetical protein